MAYPEHPNPTGIIPRVRFTFLDGDSAGDVTLTGITTDDRLLSVQVIDLALTEAAPNTTDSWSPSDLTSEFSITAADTINNADGTDTTGDLLFVVWYDADWGQATNI